MMYCSGWWVTELGTMSGIFPRVTAALSLNQSWCFLVQKPKEAAALHDNSVTVLLLQTVIEEVHWRVQPTAARLSRRFSKIHGALHPLHMSLSDISMRTVHKWLKGTWPRLHSWILWRYHVWGVTHKAILKLSPEPERSFWIKVSLYILCVFSLYLVS